MSQLKWRLVAVGLTILAALLSAGQALAQCGTGMSCPPH